MLKPGVKKQFLYWGPAHFSLMRSLWLVKTNLLNEMFIWVTLPPPPCGSSNKKTYLVFLIEGLVAVMYFWYRKFRHKRKLSFGPNTLPMWLIYPLSMERAYTDHVLWSNFLNMFFLCVCFLNKCTMWPYLFLIVCVRQLRSSASSHFVNLVTSLPGYTDSFPDWCDWVMWAHEHFLWDHHN